MSAVQADFTVANNETWSLSFTWPGVDLTGHTLKMQARDPANLGNVVVELSTDNERLVITDAAGGVWALNLPAPAAAAIAAGSYAYDVLDYLANDPRVWRRQVGTVTVEQGVTVR